MKRIEVVLTQAIESDFLQLYERECRRINIKCKYTKIENVMGSGNTNPKLGDSIWPQIRCSGHKSGPGAGTTEAAGQNPSAENRNSGKP